MLKTIITDKLYNYCLYKGVREHPELIALREASQRLSNGQMLISPDQGALMAMLARLMNAKKYLEIGLFTGYSSLWMALSMPVDAEITTLDISDKHLDLAKNAWKKAGVADKIKPLIAPATNSLEQLIAINKDYDMALIDANKAEYIDYYEHCIKLVRPGGLIIIDNVLMHGGVLEANPSKNYLKTLQQLNDLLKNDERVDIALLTIGDGMTLARKKDL